MVPNDFGWAIQRLKDGKRVARQGWNGKGMYLFLDRLTDPKGNPMAHHNPFISMKTAQGTIQPGWLASQADILGEDWVTTDPFGSPE